MKPRPLHVYSNEAMAALQCFLNHVALPNYRARYLDLITRPKSRRKFLSALHHELRSGLDPAKRIDSLAPELLRMPGYLFSASNHDFFGEQVNTLAEFLSTNEESFLLITTDGTVGVYGPETYIDDREYYAA